MRTINCQTLVDPDQSHRLMVYTAAPGTESHGMLAVLGARSLYSGAAAVTPAAVDR